MALAAIAAMTVLLAFIYWCGWTDARADAAIEAERAQGVTYVWRGTDLERVAPATAPDPARTR